MKLGIRNAMQAAEEKVLSSAKASLSAPRYEELTSSQYYVAGNYPGPEWSNVVGFVPDQKIYYQVTIGIAVPPTEKPNIFAQALISRVEPDVFCHIQWEPTRVGT